MGVGGCQYRYRYAYIYIYNLAILHSVRYNICNTIKNDIARKQNNVTCIQKERVKTDDSDLELYKDCKISMINMLRYL